MSAVAIGVAVLAVGFTAEPLPQCNDSKPISEGVRSTVKPIFGSSASVIRSAREIHSRHLLNDDLRLCIAVATAPHTGAPGWQTMARVIYEIHRENGKVDISPLSIYVLDIPSSIDP